MKVTDLEPIVSELQTLSVLDSLTNGRPTSERTGPTSVGFIVAQLAMAHILCSRKDHPVCLNLPLDTVLIWSISDHIFPPCFSKTDFNVVILSYLISGKGFLPLWVSDYIFV